MHSKFPIDMHATRIFVQVFHNPTVAVVTLDNNGLVLTLVCNSESTKCVSSAVYTMDVLLYTK